MLDIIEEDITYLNKNKENKMEKEYDTIVLSGGGINGMSILGAIQYLDDKKRINNIRTYIGSSVGAIISYLLIIGYKPIDIIIYIRENEVLKSLDIKNININNILNASGVLKYENINKYIEDMTMKKIGRLMNMEELYKETKKEMICTAYNWTTQKLEYISYKNYPEISCLDAIRMSSNLPLIFEPFEYKNNIYYDGAIVDLFPIDIAYKYGEKIVGIYLSTALEVNNSNSSNNNNILGFLYKLIFTPIIKLRDNKILKILESVNYNKYELYNLYIKNEKDIYDFNIDILEILNLFSEGYKCIKDYN